jgi:hypothetical protein
VRGSRLDKVAAASVIRGRWRSSSSATHPRCWPGCFRRLSKDYEYLTATSEAVIQP